MTAFAIVMAALAGALVVLAAVAVVGWRYYKRLTRREAADFLTYNAYAAPDGILFLGDSLTDFFPVNEYFTSAARLYNRGIAGDTTFDVLARVGDAVAVRPKKVFLQIGVNDLIYLSRRKAAPAAVAGRVAEIAAFFPDAERYVLSLYPINRGKSLLGRFICGKADNGRVRAVNAELVRRAEPCGYRYIDVHARLADEKGNLSADCTLEGLHLSARGYAVVADALRPYIEA